MNESRIADLSNKEVINVCDGKRLGYIYDVVIDVDRGTVLAIVVPGPCKFFGLFGREEDYVIPWRCIEKWGEDIILVSFDVPCCKKDKKNWCFFK